MEDSEPNPDYISHSCRPAPIKISLLIFQGDIKVHVIYPEFHTSQDYEISKAVESIIKEGFRRYHKELGAASIDVEGTIIQ